MVFRSLHLFLYCHATFYYGIRTILVSIFWWWGDVHNEMIESLQQFFFSSSEYDITSSFFIVIIAKKKFALFIVMPFFFYHVIKLTFFLLDLVNLMTHVSNISYFFKNIRISWTFFFMLVKIWPNPWCSIVINLVLSITKIIPKKIEIHVLEWIQVDGTVQRAILFFIFYFDHQTLF